MKKIQNSYDSASYTKHSTSPNLCQVYKPHLFYVEFDLRFPFNFDNLSTIYVPILCFFYLLVKFANCTVLILFTGVSLPQRSVITMREGAQLIKEEVNIDRISNIGLKMTWAKEP